MAYVYQHIRLDTNTIFYIGIGKTKYRLTSRQGRNDLWYNIVAKAGFRAEILFDDLNWEEAAKKEIELISRYGRLNNGTGLLANMTDGGDGNLGLVHSPEALRKISQASIGRPGYWKGKKMPAEAVEKTKKAVTGRPNYKNRGRTMPDHVKKIISETNKGNKYGVGKPFTEERKRNISEANKGRTACNKGKPGLAGSKNGMFGRRHTKETIEKIINNTQHKRPVIKCDLNGIVIYEYASISEAARLNEVFVTGIQAACKGRFPSYKGFIWRYKI